MRVLRIVVPLLLLALLWQVADGPAALAQLLRADPGWLLAGLLLLHLQTLLSALRWSRVAIALGQPLTPAEAAREYYVAQVVNQTLPGGVPGDVLRATRMQGRLGRAALSVVLERAAGQGAMLGILAVALGLSLAFGGIGWPGVAPWLYAAALSAGVAALVIWLRPGLAPARRKAMALLSGPGGAAGQIALSLAIAGLNIAAFACAARATGTTLASEAALTLIPLILTAMLIPLSIGGWGWREGAAALLFPLAGATQAAGLAASAGFGAMVLTAAPPGVLWLIRPATRPE